MKKEKNTVLKEMKLNIYLLVMAYLIFNKNLE